MALSTSDLLKDLTDTDRSNIQNAHEFELSSRVHASVSADPFYSVSSETVTAELGTLLKLEAETDTSLYSLPPNLSLSRFIYQSATPKGRHVPVSGYVLWPYVARPHESGLPVTVWAHGTSGVSDECPPSNRRDLWHHFQVPYLLALHGYVVVATDYAGLGVGADAKGQAIIHEYLTGPAQANDVYYSIPAARAAFPQLSKQFVVIGGSQGGGAAWSFAEKVAAEPLEGYLGTVALHPANRLLDLPRDSALIPYLLILLAPSLKARYPDFDPAEIFTAAGIRNVEILARQKGCTTTLFQLPDINQTLKPNWRDHPVIQEYQACAATSRRPFRGPLLVIQGQEDPIIDAETIRWTVEETAGMFPDQSIEFHMLPGVTHAPLMYAGSQIYMEWIGKRFEGREVEAGLKSFRAQPVRSGRAMQGESNWFIGAQREGWQVA
ncbi:MAG: hypothetical protein Q9191_001989 [Dirinaria sp. TL-2023a]